MIIIKQLQILKRLWIDYQPTSDADKAKRTMMIKELNLAINEAFLTLSEEMAA